MYLTPISENPVASLQELFSSLPRETVVGLDDGVKFPGTQLGQLYVRGCYVDLLDVDADQRTRHPKTQLTYITGTPGDC